MSPPKLILLTTNQLANNPAQKQNKALPRIVFRMHHTRTKLGFALTLTSALSEKRLLQIVCHCTHLQVLMEVACAAGPRAALNDVAGKGTECGEEPALMLFNSMPLERKGADAEG